MKSNKTKPRLGLMGYSQPDWFSIESIVGSTDYEVLHRPVELAPLSGTGRFGQGITSGYAVTRPQSRNFPEPDF
jgi:hypothetical protein